MGVNFAIGKQHDIKLFTIYQRQLMNLENDFILGVGYAYSLKKQKDKRKKKTDQ